MGFTYGGVHSSDKGIYKARPRRPILPPVEARLLDVPGRAGAYYQGHRYGVRELRVDVVLAEATRQDLRNTVRSLAAWLAPDAGPRPLKFDDEPDKEWLAVLSGETDLEELALAGFGTLTFLCPHPFALGNTVQVPLADGTVVNAGGTAPTWPVIRATAQQDMTYLAIATQDRYLLLGQPESTEQAPAEGETLILRDDLNTTVGWTVPPSAEVMNGVVTGTMTSTSGEFRASDYGTGAGWHGPALKKSLSEPLQDFHAFARVRQNNNTGQTGRAELYLLDANGVIVAMISVRDRWATTKQVEARADVGNASGQKNIFVGGAEKPHWWNGYDGFLRVHRKGKQWWFQWGLIDPATGRQHTRLNAHWYDAAGAYQAKVAQVLLWLSTYGTDQPTDQAFKSVDIWRINSLAPTQVPYIARVGDIVEVDCERHAVYVNGEPRLDLLDPGSEFFTLVPGQPETFVVAPAGAATITLEYRERWL